MTVTVELADPEDRETFAALMGLGVAMVEEVALVKVDPEKVAAKVATAINAGLCFVAKRDDTIVGTLGLKETEFDYAEGTFLIDSWFYVAKGERFGDVGVKLLRAAREYAASAGKFCFIAAFNPSRHGRKTELGLYFEIAGFLPFGHITRIT